MFASQERGETDRMNAFVQRWANNETAKLVCKGRNVIITLPGRDGLKQSLDVPGRKNYQHPHRRVC
jgi:hypothetical protein